MRFVVLYALLVCSFVITAQDKIYLLNGECRTGKILEIFPDAVQYLADGEKQSIGRPDILLVEYRNGLVEVFNSPTENAVYMPEGTNIKRHRDNEKKLSANNQLSFNSLALCNSDVAVFYERLILNKQLGLGLMGAYNFNSYAGVYNSYINVLSGGRKNYDLGLSVNFYPISSRPERAFYFGLMIKYTDISFYRTITQGPTPGGNLNYVRVGGSQLATMFTIGVQRFITRSIFVKSFFGIGGFRLHGDYKTEYNYIARGSVLSNSSPSSSGLKAKVYLGLNVGYNF